MAQQVAYLDFSSAPRDFRPVALEPGYPLIDPGNANARIVAKWLGRFAAEPERRGQKVSWFLRSEQGARLDGITVLPVSQSDLKGVLKKDLAELTRRLESIAPQSRGEKAVHRVLSENLAIVLGTPSPALLSQSFGKYRDETGKWRLLWFWGFERINPSETPAIICTNPDCRLMYLDAPTTNEQCPRCETKKPIPPNPKKRLAIAAFVILLLGAAGGYGWWWLQPRAELKGAVLWAGNDQPIANATVAIPDLDLTTTTNESGLFSFMRLPEGEFDVAISAEGYHSFEDSQELTIGKETFLNARLEGNGQIQGQVVMEGSKAPLTGAEIRLSGTDWTTQTASDGHFQILKLPPGSHALTIVKDGFPEQATTIKISPQETAEPVVTLTGEGIVSGIVARANSEDPISGASVEIEGTGQRTETDADGIFVVKNVPRGNCELIINAQGFESKRLTLIVGDTERSQRVFLLGAGILKGTITSKDENEPLAQAKIGLKNSRQTIETQSDGTYTLVGIPGGQATVVVSAPGYRTLEKTVVIQPRDPTRFDVGLEGGAVLEGIVQDGTTNKPLVNARVNISAYPKPLRTDELGRFKRVGIKAGPATIRVEAQGFQPVSLPYTLRADDEKPVEIKLFGDGKLTGTLVDATTKKPIAGAMVQIDKTVLQTTTNDDGTFSLAGPRSGPANIVVSAKGYPTKTLSQKIMADQPTDVAWNLAGNLTLTGTVKDLGKDAPVANAQAKIPGTNVTATTDATGKFQLNNLPALPVQVAITAAGYNDQTVESTLSADQPNTVDVLLGGDAAVSGKVFDALTGQPLMNVKIGLKGYSLATRTDAEGKFTLKNAFRGANTVTASSEKFPEQTQSVQLESDATKQISFGLKGTSSATGVVQSSEGLPIAGATVKYPNSKHASKTDAQGKFQLDQLPGGVVSLEVSADHFATGTVKGKLDPTGVTKLTPLQLQSRLKVSGRVIDALTGSGLANVAVSIEKTKLETVSDDQGGFEIPSVPVRDLILDFSREGYYPESLRLDPVNPPSAVQAVLAPQAGLNQTHLVLTWGADTKDLDLHLYGPESDGKRPHVWRKERESEALKFHVENQTGLGPESLTLDHSRPGRYEIVIHGPGEKMNLSAARLRIYERGAERGRQISVSTGESASRPVWEAGAIEISSGGKAKWIPYNRLNYKTELP